MYPQTQTDNFDPWQFLRALGWGGQQPWFKLPQPDQLSALLSRRGGPPPTYDGPPGWGPPPTPRPYPVPPPTYEGGPTTGPRVPPEFIGPPIPGPPLPPGFGSGPRYGGPPPRYDGPGPPPYPGARQTSRGWI